MEEKEFIKWLPLNVEAFKNMDDETVISALNEVAKTEEGKTQLSKLWDMFKKSKQSFKKGGKLRDNDRCSCGCKMNKIMEKGGKIVRKCSCGCKGK